MIEKQDISKQTLKSPCLSIHQEYVFYTTHLKCWIKCCGKKDEIWHNLEPILNWLGESLLPFTIKNHLNKLGVKALWAQHWQEGERRWQQMAERFLGWAAKQLFGIRRHGGRRAAAGRPPGESQKGSRKKDSGGQRQGWRQGKSQGWPYLDEYWLRGLQLSS